MEQLELLLTERELPEQTPQKQYIIPQRAFNPGRSGKESTSWIVEFHRANRMPLPEWFEIRDKDHQRIGMFYGMINTYGISISRQIIVD